MGYYTALVNMEGMEVWDSEESESPEMQVWRALGHATWGEEVLVVLVDASTGKAVDWTASADEDSVEVRNGVLFFHDADVVEVV